MIDLAEDFDDASVLVETLIGLNSQQPLVKVTVGKRTPFFCTPQDAVDMALSLLQAAASSRTDFALLTFFQAQGLELDQIAKIIGAVRATYQQQPNGDEEQA